MKTFGLLVLSLFLCTGCVMKTKKSYNKEIYWAILYGASLEKDRCKKAFEDYNKFLFGTGPKGRTLQKEPMGFEIKPEN